MSIPAFSRAQSTLFDTGAGLDNPDRRSAAYKFGSSSPLPSFSSNFGTAPIPADETRPVITKRVNARLQLAAALIEADNESIAQRAAAAAAAAQKAALADPDTPKPPPPPQVKLASQSAIFAPYRQGNIPLPHHRKRTGSNASRLSRLSRLDGDERRPSIDFLGVTLPTEKKYGSAGPRTHSRADSSIGIGGGHSRTNSLLSLNGPLKPGEVAWAGPGSRPTSAMSMNAKGSQGPEDGDALSDWGVEKFLSREEKDKIESGRRSRANSTAGVVTSFGQDTRPGGGSRPGWALSVRSGPTPEAGVAEGIGKARSEIIVSATSGANGGGDLSLLARIKLYRERQENLPPSQWDGPGPTATKEEVVEHLTSMASPKRDTASLSNAAATAAAAAAHGEAGQRSSIVFPGGSGLSDAGPTGDTPSQKAPSILDRRRPHSRSNSVSSNFMLPSTSQQGDETWREGWAQSSGTEEVLKDVLPSPPIKTGNPLVGRPRRSSAAAGSILNRPRSNFGVMGDSWSDQGEGSEYGDAQSRPSSVGLDAFIPESATAANTGEAGHRFTLASADQLDSAFGPRRNSRILCAGEDGGAFGAAMDEENRAGVGSYSRGHSRRNSLMGDNLFNPREEIAGLAQTHGQQGYESPIVGDRSPHGASTPILGTGPALAEDPFSTLPGLGPSPFPASPGLRVLDLPGQPRPQQRRKSAPMDGLSTKQLQAIARGEATFPEHYGIRSSALDDSAIDSRPASPPASTMGGMGVGMSRGNSSTQGLDSLSMAGEPRSRITSMMNLGGLAMEPDLSSANWGKSRPDLGPRASFMEPGFGAFRSSGAGDESIAASMAAGRDVDERELDASLNAQAGEALSEKYAAEPVGQLFEQLTRAAAGRQEVDDEYISPPTRGPLKPKGLRPPKVLIMPTPLQGTLAAPRARKTDSDAGARGSAIYVPDGFILHDGRGLPPMRQLQVHGATGPRPLFMTPGGDKAHDALVSDFLQSEESRRTLKVPAAMPNGIGRRGASPTTALFRNQLVQHAEEREGWGWEPSSAVADAFKDSAAASETDEVPLARLAAEKEKKKKIGMRARRAAKKAKKARKKARRERREKRAQAERDGKSYKAVGVEELSPDEDLDLSSDTEDDTDSEGSDAESEISMNSDDVKRWLDTQRPAGKLFGKSLLDVVDEKKITRKTKAR